MIYIPRSAKPQILQQNEQTWLAELRVAHAAVLTATSDDERKQAVKEFKSKQSRYAHSEVRRALVAIFGKNGLTKCAFCEAHISHISDDNIEHFRPKSDYLDFTFDWDNLLIACTVCNRDYKKTQFPMALDGSALLINPTRETPETHLDFQWDGKTKLATVAPKDQRGLETERCLGLNRDELRDKRSQYVQMLALIAQRAPTSQLDRDLLCEATKAEWEFAAFARVLATQVGISCP